jgi:chromosome segregation ATPase
MEPKTVAEVLAKISQQYETSCKDRAAMDAALESRSQAILALQNSIAAQGLEISELKKQRDTDLPRLAREIEGWKAKCVETEKSLALAAINAEEILSSFRAIQAEIADVKAKLAAETARAAALAEKYDPEIKADLAAKAETERLRQIAELEAKLKALKKEI